MEIEQNQTKDNLVMGVTDLWTEVDWTGLTKTSKPPETALTSS